MTDTDSTRRGSTLVRLARSALETEIGGARPADSDDLAMHEIVEREPWLAEPGASFVTLRRDGELRGCLGSIEAVRPLHEDIRYNAVAAARRDPRFAPLAADELDQVDVEVTVLSSPQPISFTSEADALAQLRPGVDGVILCWRRHRSTYLPQVWESLQTPEAFLASLKRKAGLKSNFWHPEIELQRYTAEHWSER